jgi:hypothetical protein
MRKIEDLIRKYNAGKCSVEEKIWLEQWYHSFEWNNKGDLKAGKESEDLKDEVWLAIQKNIPDFKLETVKPQNNNIPSSINWRRYAAAAVLFITIAGTVFYFLRQPVKESDAAKEIAIRHEENNDVVPGTSRAQLVLGDGSVISLDSARNMQLREKDGTYIDKQSGKLVYNDHAAATGDILFNTLSTPVAVNTS